MGGCAKFSYWPDSTDCYFSDDKAEPQPSQGVVAGLAVCPVANSTRRALCTSELPGNGFPGFTGKVSNEAWPSGKQPQSLECWPRNATGGYMACKQATVLEDTDRAWPGKCKGLAKRNGTFAQCAEDCMRNPLCPSWQTSRFGCWQGMGMDCFVRVDFTPIRAQRVQHGSVRVLWDLTGWQIVGLAKSFDNKHGYFLRQEDAITACKGVCYSDIRCQYWQYTPRYGCWVEDASQAYHPPWPLTTDWAYRSTQFALDCVAGEYIQHVCPPNMATPFRPLMKEMMTSCMRQGYAYDPPDMRWQGRTVEMNAETCQERCRNTKDCAFFTYWPDGSCHLQDEHAVRTVAKNYGVTSGPALCDSRPTTTTLPPPKDTETEARTAGPRPERETAVAEIMVQMLGVSWTELGNFTQERLKRNYVRLLSRRLGVHTSDVRSRPGGPGKTVLVQESFSGSDMDVQRPDLGMMLVAYVETDDVSRIRRITLSDEFKQALMTATHKVRSRWAARDSKKGTGLVKFSSPSRGDVNLTSNLRIGLRRVHALSGTVPTGSRQSHEADGCGFSCRWWPLFCGILLMLLTCCVAAGACYISRRSPRKRRGAKSEASGSVDANGVQDPSAGARTTSRGLGGGGIPADVCTAAPRQETQPLVANLYQLPMHAVGFGEVSSQRSYAPHKRGGEFEV